MVDENRDPLLATLFRIRADRNDETFLARWHIDSTRIRVFNDPDAREALIAYTPSTSPSHTSSRAPI